MTYIDDAVEAINAELPGLDPELAAMYALLLLVRGESTTLADVHDAWAVWRCATDPGHRSVVPFDRLTPQVQELNRKYAEGIRAAALAVARRQAARGVC